MLSSSLPKGNLNIRLLYEPVSFKYENDLGFNIWSLKFSIGIEPIQYLNSWIEPEN
jgi:hypothetical protein